MIARNDSSDFISKYVIFILTLLLSNVIRFDVGFSLTIPILMLPFTFMLIYIKRIKVYIYKEDIFLFFFYLFCAMSFVYSINVEYTSRFIFGSILMCLLLVSTRALLIGRDLNSILDKTGLCYVLLNAIFYFIGFIKLPYLSEHDLYFGVFIEKGLPRLTGTTIDPNFAALCLSFFSVYFLTRKNYFLFLFSTILVVLTLSRSGMISLVLAILFILLFTGSLLLKTRNITIIILVVIMFYIGVSFLDSNILDEVLQKRTSGVESGAGRFDLWSSALSFIYERPLLGSGIFTFRDLYFKASGEARFAHNTFIEIATEVGILGFMIFLFFIVSLFNNVVRLSKNTYYRYMLPSFLLLVVMSNTLSIYINSVFAFFVIIFSYKDRKGGE